MYAEFTRRFPTIRSLARAPLADVLRAWQGLGYNRRAKMLREAAKEIVARHAGRVPRDVRALEALPGVGPYTARAIAAFAWNADEVFIETNIRTAVIRHFFTPKKNTPIYGCVLDAQIASVLAWVLPHGRAREWYAALMDYGAYLKRSGVKLNPRSAHYTKQVRFAGSAREARGTVLRGLLAGPASEASLTKALGPSRASQMKKALAALIQEGLVVRTGKQFSLPR